jgi:V8-like Glu-specific endopeptidase
MKPVRIGVMGGVLAAVALVAYVPVAARAATPSSATPSTAGRSAAANPNSTFGESITESPAQVNVYWTPARIAQALANPMLAPTDVNTAAKVAMPSGSAVTAAPTAPATSASPAIADALPGEHSKLWPNRKDTVGTATGKLFFVTPTGPSQCTATLLSSPNKDTIWTAGHCINPGYGGSSTIYKNFMFQPGRNGNTVPYGSFGPKYVSLAIGWVNDGIPQYDYAAMALYPNKHGKAQNVAGAQGWNMGGNTFKWSGLYIFGYPSILYPSKLPVNRYQLRYCTGSTTEQNNLLHFQCDMGPGSSGGPLVYKLNTKTSGGYIVGDLTLGRNTSYDRWSPQLGAVALATLKRAYTK